MAKGTLHKKKPCTCCNCRVSTRKCTCVTISRKRKWQQCALLSKWKIKVIAVSLMALSATIFLSCKKAVRFYRGFIPVTLDTLQLVPAIVYAVNAKDRRVCLGCRTGLNISHGSKAKLQAAIQKFSTILTIKLSPHLTCGMWAIG